MQPPPKTWNGNLELLQFVCTSTLEFVFKRFQSTLTLVPIFQKWKIVLVIEVAELYIEKFMQTFLSRHFHYWAHF